MNFDHLLHFGRRTDHPLPQPPVRTKDSWWWQCAAFAFAAERRRVVLEMGVGTGKTKTALDIIQNIAAPGPVLIAAPANVCGEWPRQITAYCVEPERWPVLRADLMPGTASERAKKLAALLVTTGETPAVKRRVVIVNYEAMIRGGLFDLLRATPWAAIIYDESHRLKGHASKTDAGRPTMSGAAARIADRQDAIVLALTGTLMPHSPLDAYGQMRIIDDSILGPSFSTFRAAHATTHWDVMRDDYARKAQIEQAIFAKRATLDEIAELPKVRARLARTANMPREMRNAVTGYRDLDGLARKLAPRVFHVPKEVLNLEPADDVPVRFALPRDARRIYDALNRELHAQLDADNYIATPNVLAKLTRLQQITSGFAVTTNDDGAEAARVIHAAKREALRGVFDRIQPRFDEQREPVVVFARFSRNKSYEVNDLAFVQAETEDYFGADSYRELSGARREYDEWADGAGHVIGVQIQAGGAGLDRLKDRSRYGVYFSTCWSLGDYEQSRGRLNRAGQARHVTFFHLIAEDTIDERFYAGYEAKREPIQYVLDALRRGEK